MRLREAEAVRDAAEAELADGLPAVRMARAAPKLGVRDVAKAAKVSPATVTRVEADQGANASIIAAIRTALEAAGVVFIAENGGGAGVRLARRPASEP